jgi:hypothetical protein
MKLYPYKLFLIKQLSIIDDVKTLLIDTLLHNDKYTCRNSMNILLKRREHINKNYNHCSYNELINLSKIHYNKTHKRLTKQQYITILNEKRIKQKEIWCHDNIGI